MRTNEILLNLHRSLNVERRMRIAVALLSLLVTKVGATETELQRVPDVFFTQNASWLEDWKFQHFHDLQAEARSIVLLLVIERGATWETIAVSAKPAASKIGLSTDLSKLQFTVIHLGSENGSGGRVVKQAPSNVTDIVRHLWDSVVAAGMSTQEPRGVLGPNEVWYVLVRPVAGPFILQMAQGINPDKGGQLRSIYNQLIK